MADEIQRTLRERGREIEMAVRKIAEPDVSGAIQMAIVKMQEARSALNRANGLGHNWMMEREVGFLSSVRGSRTANDKRASGFEVGWYTNHDTPTIWCRFSSSGNTMGEDGFNEARAKTLKMLLVMLADANSKAKGMGEPGPMKWRGQRCYLMADNPQGKVSVVTEINLSFVTGPQSNALTAVYGEVVLP